MPYSTNGRPDMEHHGKAIVSRQIPARSNPRGSTDREVELVETLLNRLHCATANARRVGQTHVRIDLATAEEFCQLLSDSIRTMNAIRKSIE